MQHRAGCDDRFEIHVGIVQLVRSSPTMGKSGQLTAGHGDLAGGGQNTAAAADEAGSAVGNYRADGLQDAVGRDESVAVDKGRAPAA